MMFTPEPKPAEWMHHKSCLATALICAVENVRDREGFTSFDFKIAAQQGDIVQEATGYLINGDMECVCPEGHQG